jgi:hypothetical protein
VDKEVAAIAQSREVAMMSSTVIAKRMASGAL